MDEALLAQAAKNGDLNAFNRLVLEYQDLAYNVAFRLLSDPDSASDALQEAVISAYRSLDNYRGGSFKSWLLRMVTNKCYDELRRRKRRPTIPLEPNDPETDEEIESPNWLADDSPSPEEEMMRMDLDKAVQDCINHLPEEFRAVVVMVDMQAMDYQEAAEIIGKPLGTIKSRLARARIKLRDCLQQFRELLPAVFRLETEETL
jgi:RNA polymerase sigma-70 factor (ECF subfamily)